MEQHGALKPDINELAIQIGLSDRVELLQRAALLAQYQQDHDQESLLALEPAASKVLNHETAHPWHQPRLLYFTIFICSLGAIEQGWAQTGMNGANLYLAEALDLTPERRENAAFLLGLINCAMYLSNGLVGCWLSEPVNNAMGRRGAIFIGTLLCLIGNLGCALIPSAYASIPILVAFRLTLGVGMGLNASTVSVFAAESAPAYIRGGLAVSWQMFVAFGVLLGFLANVAVYNLEDDLIWRLQLAAPALPTIPLLMLVYFCPESPSWYMKRSQWPKAFSSLRRLRSSELQAAVELYSFVRSNATTNQAAKRSSYGKKLISLYTEHRNFRALLASFTVMLSQQLCGINIVAFFSSTIFSRASGSMILALWASVIFGLVNFLGAFPAIWTMDSFGRRRLLLWTLPPMSVTMAGIAVVIGLPESTARFIVLASLIYLFCALYSPGMGPVPCAYSAEVFPLDVREIGMSLGISTANIWATVLSLTTPPLFSAIGDPGVFGLYAGLNVLAWFLCWLFVRETKGLRLEQMEVTFESSCSDFVRGNWQEGLRRWHLGSKAREGYGELQQYDSNEA